MSEPLLPGPTGRDLRQWVGGWLNGTAALFFLGAFIDAGPDDRPFTSVTLLLVVLGVAAAMNGAALLAHARANPARRTAAGRD